ncbi:hypothetical protein O181_093671 [Austropuccinia psidii MF-1]|uniref:Uncharacterized protein n=1 Tax=Austropuccinia psidii MF-1 TaxID=1389203 RepID=A0A9Q3PBQ2_9BASI|nr:hypothetical protein [Austropuccinia psidii MF-1]
MEHGQQEVQPGISLGRTCRKLPEDLSQRDRLQGPYGNHQRLESYQAFQTPGGKGNQDKGESSHYPSYRRTADPDRAYSHYFRLTRSRSNQLSSGFMLFRNQQISGQESPFFKIPGGFKEKTRKQGEKKDLLQPEEERVGPHDPEAVGFGERSAQEAEVVVNMSACDSKPEHKHDSQNTINQCYSQDTTKTWSLAKSAQKVSKERGNSPLSKNISPITIGQEITKLFLLKVIAEHKP